MVTQNEIVLQVNLEAIVSRRYTVKGAFIYSSSGAGLRINSF